MKLSGIIFLFDLFPIFRNSIQLHFETLNQFGKSDFSSRILFNRRLILIVKFDRLINLQIFDD